MQSTCVHWLQNLCFFKKFFDKIYLIFFFFYFNSGFKKKVEGTRAILYSMDTKNPFQYDYTQIYDSQWNRFIRIQPAINIKYDILTASNM